MVVVGTGVSGHNIARDYHEQCYAVTIVQRSPTCVDASDYTHGQAFKNFPLVKLGGRTSHMLAVNGYSGKRVCNESD